MNMLPLVLAITGASGAIYGVRLLEVLLSAGRTIYLTISPSGQTVLDTELGLKVDLDHFSPTSILSKSRIDTEVADRQVDKIRYCHFQDLMSPIASGNFTLAWQQSHPSRCRSALEGTPQIDCSATRNAAVVATNRQHARSH